MHLLTSSPPRRFGRGAILAIAVLVVALGTSACSGDGDRTQERGSPATLLDPATFAARLDAAPEAMVVNVHVPYEGELDGTDAFIPFDRVVGDDLLPADKDAEILLYCRSGNMSRTAAEDLAREGYTNLYDLEGGMRAWEAAGKTLVHRPEDPGRN